MNRRRPFLLVLFATALTTLATTAVHATEHPQQDEVTFTLQLRDGSIIRVTTADEEFVWLGVGAANDAVDDDGDPVNPTMCWAEVAGASNSSIDVEGCEMVTVGAGEDEADCTMTASVFFEGIPTLSQYGMALMALLMLGMGFVGMRRFV